MTLISFLFFVYGQNLPQGLMYNYCTLHIPDLDGNLPDRVWSEELAQSPDDSSPPTSFYGQGLWET